MIDSKKDIPNIESWGNTDKSQDLKYAYELFYGKSNSETYELYYRSAIERADELRFFPIIPFQYYIVGFGEFIKNNDFPLFETADIASSYLKLIYYMLKNKSNYIIPIINDISDIVDYICENQSFFEADVEIYGDFLDEQAKIKELISKNLDLSCPNVQS